MFWSKDYINANQVSTTLGGEGSEMSRKKLMENSQGEPAPNQTKLRQAAAHTIFSFLFFSF